MCVPRVHMGIKVHAMNNLLLDLFRTWGGKRRNCGGKRGRRGVSNLCSPSRSSESVIVGGGGPLPPSLPFRRRGDSQTQKARGRDAVGRGGGGIDLDSREAALVEWGVEGKGKNPRLRPRDFPPSPLHPATHRRGPCSMNRKRGRKKGLEGREKVSREEEEEEDPPARESPSFFGAASPRMTCSP